MPSILLLLNPFFRLFILIVIIFFTESCSFLTTSTVFINNYNDSLKNAPQGSYVKRYNHRLDNTNTNYKIFLNKNLGETRHNTEEATLIIPINFNTISFELRSNHDLIQLKTPLKLINITDMYGNSVASINLHNKIYWIKTKNTYQKIPLFLDIKKQKFIIFNEQSHCILEINHQKYMIPTNNRNNNLMIGIMRYDLLRYRGQIVPKQSLFIDNIHIENNNATDKS